MSEKLFEAGFQYQNIKSFFNTAGQSTSIKPGTNDTQQIGGSTTGDDTTAAAKVQLPGAEEWDKWEALLAQRQEANRSAKKKKTELEIENAFFEDFFSVCWGNDATLTKCLIGLGAPLKKAIKTLGFSPILGKDGNPLLAFLLQDFAKNLLKDRKLDALTFKAVYNAVAKRLIADSEFFKQNNYNILYCKDLYNKPAAEMEKYIELQSEILVPDAASQGEKAQNNNKLIFINTDGIDEYNPVRRAVMLNDPNKIEDEDLRKTVEAAIASIYVAPMETATLNSYEIAKAIKNKGRIEARIPETAISSKKQDELVRKLTGDIASIYAVLTALHYHADSKNAIEALKNDAFKGLDGSQIATAIQQAKTIIPAGIRISTKDADALVGKLLASLS